MPTRMISLNKKHSIDFRKVLDPNSKKWQQVAKPGGPFTPLDSCIYACQYCGIVESSFCPKCLETPYCTTTCYLKDKDRHSSFCGQITDFYLAIDESGCLYYSAMRSIRDGVEILRQDVPVILPTLPEGFQEKMTKNVKSFPITCLGCHKHFYAGEKQEVCSGCGFFVCSIYCPSMHHNETECEILRMAYGRNFSSFTSNPRKYIEFFLDICVLRVLRSFAHGERDAFVAERYRKFTMLANTSRFKNFDKMKRDPYDGIAYLKLLNKSVERLQMSMAYALYNRQVVQQIFKTMIVFWELDETMSTSIFSIQRSRLLFLHRHFLTQSYCSANVGATVDFTNSKPTWRLFTTKGIDLTRDKNLRLMFDFTPSRFTSLPMRMLYLNENGFKNYCFWKNGPYCGLCQNPSEGESHAGSIRCLKCNKGLYIEGGVRGKDLLLYDFPQRWSEEYLSTVEWNCNKCGDPKPFSLILDINQRFLKLYLDGIRNNPEACLLSDIEKFVDSYEPYLHPKNAVILRAKFDFVRAAREKHLFECGFNANGLPRDPYHEEKVLLGLTDGKNLKVSLFPVNWNREEEKLMKIRAKYANDCLSYLLDIRKHSSGRAAMENFTDFCFLKVERSLLELLDCCHRYFHESRSGVQKEFTDAGRLAAKVIQDYCRKVVFNFYPIRNSDPLLKWSPELKYFGDLIDRKCEAPFLARVILQLMRINEAKFMLDEDVEPKKQSIEG